MQPVCVSMCTVSEMRLEAAKNEMEVESSTSLRRQPRKKVPVLDTPKDEDRKVKIDKDEKYASHCEMHRLVFPMVQ